jgi:hypothetical protein
MSKPNPLLRHGTGDAWPRCCEGSIASSTASTRPSDRMSCDVIDVADARPFRTIRAPKV